MSGARIVIETEATIEQVASLISSEDREVFVKKLKEEPGTKRILTYSFCASIIEEFLIEWTSRKFQGLSFIYQEETKKLLVELESYGRSSNKAAETLLGKKVSAEVLEAVKCLAESNEEAQESGNFLSEEDATWYPDQPDPKTSISVSIYWLYDQRKQSFIDECREAYEKYQVKVLEDSMFSNTVK